MSASELNGSYAEVIFDPLDGHFWPILAVDTKVLSA
jgi:hypothetical protein